MWRLALCATVARMNKFLLSLASVVVGGVIVVCVIDAYIKMTREPYRPAYLKADLFFDPYQEKWSFN